MPSEENETASEQGRGKLRCPDCGGDEIWTASFDPDKARCHYSSDCGWRGRIVEAEDAARRREDQDLELGARRQGSCIACGSASVTFLRPNRASRDTAALATSMRRCEDCGARFSKATPGLADLPRRRRGHALVDGLEEVARKVNQGVLRNDAYVYNKELARQMDQAILVGGSGAGGDPGFPSGPIQGSCHMTSDGVWHVFNGHAWVYYEEPHKS